MHKKIEKGEYRTLEQLKHQYEIEKELANILRTAPPKKRLHLYSSLYDEFYRRVWHHPDVNQKSNSESNIKKI